MVLDPGCGTGGFFHHKPSHVDVSYVGIDNCPIATAIAKNAHGKFGANFYQTDFTKWNYPVKFKAVIGNVPFTNGNEWFRYKPFKMHIGLHAQFFFMASVFLKPGGVMALLTSTSTLDARGKDYIGLREYLARNCELLKAVRLPSNGGVHIGKTEVTTDLVILQKREARHIESSTWQTSREHPLDSADGAGWIKSVDSGLTPPSGDDIVHINEYFLNNPGYLIGVPSVNKLRGKNGNPAYTFALEAEPNTNVLHELQLRLTQDYNYKPQETKTMTTTTTAASNNWQAFQIRYVDKKGAIPGCDAIQIHFPEKPPKMITEALSKVKYLFHSNGSKYWYAYLTPSIEKWTLEVLLKKYAAAGAKITAPKTGETTPETPTVTTPVSQSAPGATGKVGISEMMALMQEMFSRIVDLQQQVDATREDFSEMRSLAVSPVSTEQIQKLEGELACKDADILFLKDKISEAQTVVVRETEKSTKLAEENAELVKEIKRLNALVTEKDDCAKSIKVSLDAVEKERNALANKQTEMQDVISLLQSYKETDRKAHDEKIKELEATITAMRSQMEEWGIGGSAETMEQLPSLDDEDLPLLDDEELPSLDDDEDLPLLDDACENISDAKEEIKSWDDLDDDSSKNV